MDYRNGIGKQSKGILKTNKMHERNTSNVSMSITGPGSSLAFQTQKFTDSLGS